MIPVFVFMLLMDSNGLIIDPMTLITFITIWLFGYTVLHYVIDDAKANKMQINLIVDQLLHLLQILVLWLTLSAMYLGRVVEHLGR